ncbi:M28 family peptidase [bacterium AH-315-E10]|nr:M28 family peptidase [bacterium AH-315-E10]
MTVPLTQGQWQRHASQEFDPDRVIQDIEKIYDKARWCSTRKLQQLARQLKQDLKSDGFSNVEVLQVPGDGKHHYGGWTAPLSWSPKLATLDIISSGKKQRLANYRKIPHQLMMFSGGTPVAGVKAELVLAPETIDRNTSRKVKGRIVLHDRYNDLDFNLALFQAGACGVICDKVVEIKGIKEGAYLNDAISFHNYSLPCWYTPKTKRGIGFVISPRQGHDLRSRLQKGEHIMLLAKVAVEMGKGTTPLITFTVPGKSKRDIILTGHFDEPGACDNASGPAMAIEIGRTLLAKQKRGETPLLQRGLRFFFGIEVRSMQWLLNEKPDYLHNGFLGLNLDMLCTSPRKSHCQFVINHSMQSYPDYGLPLLLDALSDLTKKSDYQLQLHGLDTNDNAMGDPAFAIPTPIIIQCPDRTYHTHFDSPDICDAASIKRLGSVIAAYIGWASNANYTELSKMADLNYAFSCSQLKDAAAAIKNGKQSNSKGFTRHCIIREQKRIKGLLSFNQLLLDETEFSNYLDALCTKLERYWIRRLSLIKPKRKVPAQETKALVKKAKMLVPLKAFHGFFSPSGISDTHKPVIWPAMGIDQHNWSSPEWLNTALSLADGKRNAHEIYQFLTYEGLRVNLKKLMACFNALIACKYVSRCN